MADTPDQAAYLPPHARSQTSANWRVKDESPRVEPRRQNDGAKDGSNVDAGMRLYVGNLLYTASREDIEALFTSNGFTLSGISMKSAEEANRALEVMQGKELLGREVRINRGVKKQQGSGERRVRNFADGSFQTDRLHNGSTSPAFNRWTRTDGAQHSAQAQAQGLRLYVGGLPRIEPQSTCEETVRQIFNSAGLGVAAVSKIISPHPSKTDEPGNHHYCFVDMSSAEDVEAAVEMLNGTESEWGPLRVGRAKDNQNRRPVREGYERREREGGRVEERSRWR